MLFVLEAHTVGGSWKRRLGAQHLCKDHNLYNNKGEEVFVNKGAGPLTKEDAIAMTDSVHCSFVDDKIAEAGKMERTLLNTAADLTKQEFYVNFYVRDVKPVPGTNKMKDMMTKRYTIGF